MWLVMPRGVVQSEVQVAPARDAPVGHLTRMQPDLTFPPQEPTFKPCQMKTHFLLPFPVNYLGECVRTAPYTDPDHARYERCRRENRPSQEGHR